MTRRVTRLAAPLAVAAAGILGCTGLTDPDGIAALDFTGIPFPAVVSGDTMRDPSGVAAPLRATAYDGRGNEIADAPIAYVALDTGVVIDGLGFLQATRRSGQVRIVASVSGLQSQQRVIQVTREPDTVAAPTTAVEFQYRLPDAVANVSPALQLSLQTNDVLAGENGNVPGWLVRWRIIHDGDTLSPTDTSKVALWAPSGQRHTLRDTTKADGSAARRLRVYANLLPVQQDSFIVVAEILSRGTHVPGSPVRYVVTISPPGS